MSLSIKLGNFLYKHAFVLYKPMYALFKNKQDAFEIALLRKHIQQGDTILDIGANIGYYAKILSHITGPRGQVHCFEPDPDNFKHLTRACGQLKNVFLNQAAAGPRTETLKIYKSKQLNVDHRTYQPEEYDEVLDVKALSVDDYVKQQQVQKVDFIKMDIQGFEMQAFNGMKETLQRYPALNMISEFWPYGLKKAGSSVSEYFQALQNEGFRCYLLEHKSLVPLTAEKVHAISELGEEHYFNIFATRQHVH